MFQDLDGDIPEALKPSGEDDDRPFFERVKDIFG